MTEAEDKSRKPLQCPVRDVCILGWGIAMEWTGRKIECKKHFRARVDCAQKTVGYEGHDDVLSLK